MRVWVVHFVHDEYYNSYPVEGVFSSKEKALDGIKAQWPLNTIQVTSEDEDDVVNVSHTRGSFTPSWFIQPFEMDVWA